MSTSTKQNLTSNALLTLEQVAAIEHCHIVTARNRARAGQIPGARRKGRGWLINKAIYERHCGYQPGTMPLPERFAAK